MSDMNVQVTRDYDFTAAAVTEALARHLRPQLASLLKTAN